MVDEDSIRRLFGGSQLKSMAGHAAMWLVFVVVGWGVGMTAGIYLAPWLGPVVETIGATVGFAFGAWFYGRREFRSIKKAIADRDWRLLAFSVGDFAPPMLVALGGYYLMLMVSGVV